MINSLKYLLCLSIIIRKVYFASVRCSFCDRWFPVKRPRFREHITEGFNTWVCGSTICIYKKSRLAGISGSIATNMKRTVLLSLRSCDNCGDIILVRPCDIKWHKGNNWFCSRKCADSFKCGPNHCNFGKKRPGIGKGIPRPTMRGRNNPMFKKEWTHSEWAHGYRNDLGHSCRSSWEANYCRILKHLGIKYEFETNSFDIGNKETYTPDIKIHDKFFIEIKGHLYEKGRVKIERFKKRYRNTRLILITEKIYPYLARVYHKLVPYWEPDGIVARR